MMEEEIYLKTFTVQMEELSGREPLQAEDGFLSYRENIEYLVGGTGTNYSGTTDNKALADALNKAIADGATATTKVQTNLDAETNSRRSADDRLTSALTAETQARQTADTELIQKVDTAINRVTTVAATMENSISNEATARQAADNALQTNINSETATRVARDTELGNRIDQEITDRKAADSVMQTTLMNEVNKATGLLDGKQNKLTPGSGITISGNTISVNDPNSVKFDPTTNNVLLKDKTSIESANGKNLITYDGVNNVVGNTDTHLNLVTKDTVTVGSETVAYQSYVNQRITTAVPTKTSQLTNDSGFLTGVPSNYVTTTAATTSLDTRLGNYYTKPEEDASLAKKADLANVYTMDKTYSKDEVNNLISGTTTATLVFKGYIADTAPTTGVTSIKNGDLWYKPATTGTTTPDRNFPWQVYTYNTTGTTTGWTTTTTPYTPADFNVFTIIDSANTKTNFYVLNESWNGFNFATATFDSAQFETLNGTVSIKANAPIHGLDMVDSNITNVHGIQITTPPVNPTDGTNKLYVDTAISGVSAAANSAYKKPAGGITAADLANGVTTSLGKADTAYQKPASGITTADLANGVTQSLAKADTAIQTETDPTVSAWAKTPNKPAYTATEVGALPTGTTYAGSSTVGGPATSANKVNSILTIQGNGTNIDTFDGSLPKTINITPANIGAATATQGAKADSAYQAPPTGIPASALDPTVQSGLTSGTNSLQKSGGTMTGPIVLAADPTTAFQAATKQYIDNAMAVQRVARDTEMQQVQGQLGTAVTNVDVRTDTTSMPADVAPTNTPNGTFVYRQITTGTNTTSYRVVPIKGLNTAAYEPISTFASAAQGTKADTAYQKPVSGIPVSDLSSGVTTSLGKADTAYQKPNTGIPLTDLSPDVVTAIRQGSGTGNTITVETDPTVPAWAKQPTRPTYTAGDVGALPTGTTYAGSTTVGGPANSVANTLTIQQGTGTTATATVYDGSSARTVTITPNAIGAATAAQGAKADTAYQVPTGGIPTSALTSDLQTKLNNSYQKPASGITTADLAPSVVASLDKANTAIQTETDPTVPAWAKTASKPTYSASEIGALPSTTNYAGSTTSGGPATSAMTANKVANPLTIQGTGTTIDTFDGSSAKTINITPANIGAATAAQGAKADTAYQKPASGITTTDLSSGVTQSLAKADTAYQLAPNTIPQSALTTDTQAKLNNSYQVPTGGIPASALTSGVQSSLAKADTAYQKPASGITTADLSSGVTQSLAKADTAYQKPASGITTADLSSGVTQSLAKADTAIQTETDPTVPAWAKTPTKPTYTATEIGALPSTTTYAGSTTVGGPATSANKVNSTLTIQGNGTTIDTFDGSTGKTVNITPTNIGAATAAQGTKADSAYQKPTNGITTADLASGVTQSLAKADTAYQLAPNTIPESALTTDTQAKIDNAVTTAGVNNQIDEKLVDYMKTPDIMSAITSSKSGVFAVASSVATPADLPTGNTPDFQVRHVTSTNETFYSYNDQSTTPPTLRWIPFSAMDMSSYAKLTDVQAATASATTIAQQYTDSKLADKLDKTATAADSAKLGGQPASTFLTGATLNTGTTQGTLVYTTGTTATATTQTINLGLGSAAYTPSTNYATAAQGTKADTAYQKPTSGIPVSDLSSGVTTSLGKADTAYQKPVSGITTADLASGVTTSLGKADTAYQKPASGITTADLASGVTQSLAKADAAYQKPSTGIPTTDLASGVTQSLAKADTAYQLSPNSIPQTALTTDVQTKLNNAYQTPTGGIPASAMTPDVQSNLTKASTAYQKPASGITTTDLASGVTQSLAKADTAYQLAPNTIPESALTTDTQTKIDNAYQKPATGIPASAMTSDVQTAINKANTAYQLSANTIPESALTTDTQAKIDNAYQRPSTGIPATAMTSDVQSSLNLAKTAIQTETDPTVPSWAKQPTKPAYTATEVGALPSTTNYAGSSTVGGPAISATRVANSLTIQQGTGTTATTTTFDGSTARTVTITPNAIGAAPAGNYYTKPNNGIPASDLDPAVLSTIGTGSTASAVQKSGDTMTGPLILNADPTDALGAATKQYIDNTMATQRVVRDAEIQQIQGQIATGVRDVIIRTDNSLTGTSANPNGSIVYRETLENGTMTDWMTVPVKGLDSAAYQPTTAFATAAQGTKADTAYQKPITGIPTYDLSTDTQRLLASGSTAYQKPTNGIPVTDLSSGVTTSLTKADTAYQKPATGIQKTDLANTVQTSLNKADTAIQAETDPTVPAWAKTPSKPSYSASEVGALPNTTTYAGSSTVGGPATSVANSLTIQANGVTLDTYNGSRTEVINITAASVGAVTPEQLATKLDVTGTTNFVRTATLKNGTNPASIVLTTNGTDQTPITISGVVPNTTMVNGKPLTQNISLTPTDLGFNTGNLQSWEYSTVLTSGFTVSNTSSIPFNTNVAGDTGSTSNITRVSNGLFRFKPGTYLCDISFSITGATGAPVVVARRGPAGGAMDSSQAIQLLNIMSTQNTVSTEFVMTIGNQVGTVSGVSTTATDVIISVDGGTFSCASTPPQAQFTVVRLDNVLVTSPFNYYIKPDPGIPESDLDLPTQQKIDNAVTPTMLNTAIQQSKVSTFTNGGAVANAASLPTTAKDFTVYHLVTPDPTLGSNVYAVNNNGALQWMTFAPVVDLSAYSTTTDVDNKLTANSTADRAYTDSKISNLVPNTVTINGKPLTGNVALSPADIGMPTSMQVWQFTRQGNVNGSFIGIPLDTTTTGLTGDPNNVSFNNSTTTSAGATRYVIRINQPGTYRIEAAMSFRSTTNFPNWMFETCAIGSLTVLTSNRVITAVSSADELQTVSTFVVIPTGGRDVYFTTSGSMYNTAVNPLCYVNVIKLDVIGGVGGGTGTTVDPSQLAQYVKKPVTTPVTNNVMLFDSNGNAIDSGKQLTSYIQKPSSSIAGDIAIFDTSGNTIDGGKRVTDFVTTATTINGKPLGSNVTLLPSDIGAVSAGSNLGNGGLESWGFTMNWTSGWNLDYSDNIPFNLISYTSSNKVTMRPYRGTDGSSVPGIITLAPGTYHITLNFSTSGTNGVPILTLRKGPAGSTVNTAAFNKIPLLNLMAPAETITCSLIITVDNTMGVVNGVATPATEIYFSSEGGTAYLNSTGPQAQITIIKLDGAIIAGPQPYYTKPTSGIPETDLDATTQTKIDNAVTQTQLTNAINQSKASTYTIGGTVPNMASLPTTAPNFTVYRVTDTGSGVAGNVYAFNNNGVLQWLPFTQNIDLSGYPTTATVNSLISSAITADNNRDDQTYVPQTRTINGKPLTSNVVLTTADILNAGGGSLSGLPVWQFIRNTPETQSTNNMRFDTQVPANGDTSLVFIPTGNIDGFVTITQPGWYLCTCSITTGSYSGAPNIHCDIYAPGTTASPLRGFDVVNCGLQTGPSSATGQFVLQVAQGGNNIQMKITNGTPGWNNQTFPPSRLTIMKLDGVVTNTINTVNQTLQAADGIITLPKLSTDLQAIVQPTWSTTPQWTGQRTNGGRKIYRSQFQFTSGPSNNVEQLVSGAIPSAYPYRTIVRTYMTITQASTNRVIPYGGINDGTGYLQYVINPDGSLIEKHNAGDGSFNSRPVICDFEYTLVTEI